MSAFINSWKYRKMDLKKRHYEIWLKRW